MINNLNGKIQDNFLIEKELSTLKDHCETGILEKKNHPLIQPFKIRCLLGCL